MLELASATIAGLITSATYDSLLAEFVLNAGALT